MTAVTRNATLQALFEFQQHQNQPTTERYLLRVIRNAHGENYLEAVPETEMGWVDRFLAYFGCSNYNLHKVVKCLENVTSEGAFESNDSIPENQQKLRNVLTTLNKKITKYNTARLSSDPLRIFDIQEFFYRVIKQPRDGNCLYHAWSYAIRKANNRVVPVQSLRNFVSNHFQWSWKADKTQAQLLTNGIVDRNHAKREKYKQEVNSLFASFYFYLDKHLTHPAVKDIKKMSRRVLQEALVGKFDDLDRFDKETRTKIDSIKEVLTADYNELLSVLNTIMTLPTSYEQMKEVLIRAPNLNDAKACEESFSKYSSYTIKDGEWGGFPELYALMKIYKWNIKITEKRPNQPRQPVQALALMIPELKDAIGTIHLDYEDNCHWNVIES